MGLTVPCREYQFDQSFIFVQTPEGVDQTIVSYLDPKSVVLALRVCKAWAQNKSLQEKLPWVGNGYAIASGYPTEIVCSFHRWTDYSIWSLPILDLGLQYEYYIDNVDPETLSPMMRFTDCAGRAGLMLKIVHTDIYDDPRISTVFLRFRKIQANTQQVHKTITTYTPDQHSIASQSITQEDVFSSTMYLQSFLIKDSPSSYKLLNSIVFVKNPFPIDLLCAEEVPVNLNVQIEEILPQDEASHETPTTIFNAFLNYLSSILSTIYLVLSSCFQRE